nr:GIY-YIG endonuclease [Fusarium sp.]
MVMHYIKNFAAKISLKTSNLNPALKYLNADVDKFKIIKEIKGKAGIYRWINNTNGKSYVGSSVDLSKRLYRYYSLAHITVQSKHSLICKALIKYGYSKFSFKILEFCEKKNVLIREQYYIDLLKPEYNILLKAGSPLGYKHTDEAKVKMRGPKNFSLEHLTKIKEHINNLNAKRAVIIEVFDTESNIYTEYASIRLTARVLNCNDRTIARYMDSNKLFAGRYIINRKKFD